MEHSLGTSMSDERPREGPSSRKLAPQVLEAMAHGVCKQPPLQVTASKKTFKWYPAPTRPLNHWLSIQETCTVYLLCARQGTKCWSRQMIRTQRRETDVQTLCIGRTHKGSEGIYRDPGIHAVLSSSNSPSSFFLLPQVRKFSFLVYGWLVPSHSPRVRSQTTS